MKTGIYWQDPEYPAKGMDFIFDPSLVLYLPLHSLDGASLMSKDAYGHLCTATGALWTPRGRSFDGEDDYIDCGDNEGLDITNALTIEAWIYPHNIGGTGVWLDIIAKNAAYRDFGIINGKLHAVLHQGGSDYHYSSNVAPSVNEWQHVAMTFSYSANKVKFYIDGVCVRTVGANNTKIDISANTLYVGANSPIYSLFDGLIDEVRIYNRPLTPLEIQRNYLASKWRYQ